MQRDRTLAGKIRDFFINFAREIRAIAQKYAMGGNERYEIMELLGKSDALTEIAETFDRAMEAVGEKEAAPGRETVYARGKDYSDVMSKKEFKMFYDKVSEMKIGKEAQFHVSRDGQHIFDIENKLVYTDGDWYKPYIDRVVEFYFEDGTDMDAAKNLLVLNEDRGVDFEQTREILEDIYGKGCVALRLGEVRKADGRETGRGKGSAGRTLYSRNRGEVSVEEVISDTGLSVSDAGEIAYPAVQETMYSLRTLPETDYIKERDKAAAALAKRMGIEAKDAQRYIDNLTGVAAIIAADRARLDYEHPESETRFSLNNTAAIETMLSEDERMMLLEKAALVEMKLEVRRLATLSIPNTTKRLCTGHSRFNVLMASFYANSPRSRMTRTKTGMTNRKKYLKE